MSRPRYYWYDITKKLIMRYSELDETIPIEKQFKFAVDECLKDIGKKQDAQERKKAINMILIKKTHTTSGAALKLHYSERSVQYWINDFVNEVGRRAGFERRMD